MMICEPKRGWRDVLIMQRRTKIDFAHAMRHIVECYPDAEVIRVVLDNLNTHKTASLYEAFAPEEARAIARKLEFHYTPSMAAGSNIAELELAVLSNMCLSQRIADEETLRREVEANVRERNAKAIPIKWSSPLRMLGVSLLVFILAFQRDWLVCFPVGCSLGASSRKIEGANQTTHEAPNEHP